MDLDFAEAHANIVLQHGRLYEFGVGPDGSNKRLMKLSDALMVAENVASDNDAIMMARGYFHFLA